MRCGVAVNETKQDSNAWLAMVVSLPLHVHSIIVNKTLRVDMQLITTGYYDHRQYVLERLSIYVHSFFFWGLVVVVTPT